MKRLIILSVVLSFVFGLFAFSANAAKPSDYGLKEGDLISAIFSDDPDVYIINDSGYKRLFLNPTIFNFYGHLGGFFNVKLVPTEVRDAFVTSGLFRNCESNDPKVYGVDIDGEDTGKLHWVNVSAENASFEDQEFFKKVFCINNNEFNWYPKGSEFKAVKDVPKYERMKEKETVSTQEKITEKAEIKNIGQTIICHYPPDNPSAYVTITIDTSALSEHLSHGDTVGACPIPAETSAPATLVACCSASGGCKLVDTKETCLGVSGKPMSISSCSPNPCPQPTPVYNGCKQGPMKDYKCPGGTLVKWQCECTAKADGEEERYCSVKPASSCPGLASATSLNITEITVRHLLWMTKEWTIVDHIFWTTNIPANSYIEYGLTTSYGFIAGYTASPASPTTQHGTNGLPGQRNTTYHFRIIAEDTQGNKIVSDDYTFTTGL